MSLLSHWQAVLVSEYSNDFPGEGHSPGGPAPLGSREEVLSRLKDTFNALDLVSPRQAVLYGGDFNVYFDLGEEDPVMSVKLDITGDAVFILELLHRKYRWKAYNPDLEEFICPDPGGLPGNSVPAEERPLPGSNCPDRGVAGAFFIYARYFGVIAVLLVLDPVIKSFISTGFTKEALGVLISLFTWYIVFRFGLDNRFVTIRHAVLAGLGVSLALAGVNLAVYRDMDMASRVDAGSVITALSVMTLIKAIIYTLICCLGIRMRAK